MRILERPTVVQCKVCGIDVKVGTRGPIPQQCPPHRGITTRKDRKLTPRVSLPRVEVDRLRQGYADAIEMQRSLTERLAEERRLHWRTRETLRDERLELASARRRISDLGGKALPSVEPNEITDQAGLVVGIVTEVRATEQGIEIEGVVSSELIRRDAGFE